MTDQYEEWVFPKQVLGRRVLVYRTLDSTNNRAAELAVDRANDGVAVLAREQTAGRGQHGRSWQASPDSSVLLSVLLFPPDSLRRPAVLTACVAVAVCATVETLVSLPARIKWPNDILVADRKVCGILIEQARGTVVGIGLNVTQTAADFARAGLPQATSLAMLSGRPFEAPVVGERLLQQLDEDYGALLLGNLAGVEARWRHHVDLFDRAVRAECADGWCAGRLVAQGFSGLEFLQSDNARLMLEPERILHLEPVCPEKASAFPLLP
jgi:BirA family biotin operon repressor/biotin-[acetyl-CoA-carboxylase] ligase